MKGHFKDVIVFISDFSRVADLTVMTVIILDTGVLPVCNTVMEISCSVASS